MTLEKTKKEINKEYHAFIHLPKVSEHRKHRTLLLLDARVEERETIMLCM